MFITAKIAFIFTSLSAVEIYDFHIFTAVYCKKDCQKATDLEVCACSDIDFGKVLFNDLMF